jgi:hypothetical protein
LFLLKKLDLKNGDFDSKYSYLTTKIDINIVFNANHPFFRQKMVKIAENCDHSIDAWISGRFEFFCSEFAVVNPD